MADTEPQIEFQDFIYDRYLEAIEKLPQPDIFSGYVWRPAFVTSETAPPDATKEFKYILRLTDDVLPDYDDTFTDPKLHSRVFADLFNMHSHHPLVQAYTQGITVIQPSTPWPEIVRLLDKEIQVQESVIGLVEGTSEHAAQNRRVRVEARIEELEALRTFFSGTHEAQQKYNHALSTFYRRTPETVRLHAHPLLERFEKGILGIMGQRSIQRIPQTAANARRVPHPVHL